MTTTGADLTAGTMLRKHIAAASQTSNSTTATISALLETDHPELVTVFLAEQASYIFRRWVGDELRLIRMRVRSSDRYQQVRDVLDLMGANTMSIMDVSYVISEANERKTLGIMTRSDHMFVAGEYAGDAKQSSFYAAVHRAIAAKLTGNTHTATVFSEADMRGMFNTEEST